MPQVSHRWAALVTGVVLLVVVLSGVALVLDLEIHRWLHPELYRSTPSAEPIGPEQAAAVERERPDFEPVDVVRNRGVWEVHGADYVQQAHVDPGSGRLLGVARHNGGVMGFIKNSYLAASVLVLPAAGGHALQGGSRWECAILACACACLAVAVITVRLRATWAAHA